MDIKEAFSVLRGHYGSDKACAEFVGFTPQHFEAMRNGRVKINSRTAEHLIRKANEISNFTGPPTVLSAPEARP